MSAKHTPTPWSQGPTEGIGQRGRLFVVDVHGVRIADCEAPKKLNDPLSYVRSEYEDDANARLIVTAVNCHADLLDAARHAAMEWRLHGQLTDSCRVLERAIAKAEGQ